MSINKENNLLNQKIVYDLTPFTHLDFPNHLSCIVWMSRCNMRCDYCYNKDIVFNKKGKYSFEDILNFLKTRVGLLDGVVLSGGEATQNNLVPFCQALKKLRFKIKLDTNGTNHLLLQQLLELNLLDYVALDYKAPKKKFQSITHSNFYENFSKSLDLLITSTIEFEVRTTIHSDLLNEDDINVIINDLYNRGYKKTYYLQKFLPTTQNIGNISEPINSFNKVLLVDKIPIVWR